MLGFSHGRDDQNETNLIPSLRYFSSAIVHWKFEGGGGEKSEN